ncbi:glycogen synthase GlgA [Enterococcus dongliensis]|uniref:glycogen synthase GlgA n=1 Tax=Enterococcus dongliensis TaxID=2559925 RepID=UPI00288CD39C|nr:glycogen synthase GlgA [Enterococcus dongliensis]MDT2613983.1 glycogen synthase GlgA [Enterococcus dongliensis]
MKTLFVAAECAPFFKTGGLGDVAGALPKALQAKGAEIKVVLPFFTKMAQQYKNQLQDLFSYEVQVGWRRQYCGVKYLRMNEIDYYFLDNLYYFNRPELYGYYDDGERFAFYQQAVIELMEKIDFIPEIMHLNDYHTSFIPFLLKEKYHWIQKFSHIHTVLTIHNIEFQGQYDREILPDLFGMGCERYDDGTIRFNDCVNFMKAGILYADRVTTVSPAYAEEIKTPAFGAGLDPILRMESGKLYGILNGIDYDAFDPASDPAIFTNYDKTHLDKKIENKVQLQKSLALPVRPEVPVIGIVSRLTYQKGFHLLLQEMENLMQFDVQLIVLGTGDPDFEEGFQYFGQKYPHKTSIQITFDVNLAQRIYAGADMFLMPSAFEPCGLSQMISMRYGTLPIVHEIGGLKDTVQSYNPLTNEGTGFGFDLFEPFYLMNALKQAVELYHNHQADWRKLMIEAMSRDFSWNVSSQQYLDLYKLM